MEPEEKNKITPHKGGRTETRLIQMTPEIRDLSAWTLEELSRRAGYKLSMSDLWEVRIRVIAHWLKTNEGLPPNYLPKTKLHTGRLSLHGDVQERQEPPPSNSE